MARRAVWRRRLRRRRRRRRRRRPTRRRCRSRAVDAIGVHDANRNVAHVGEVEGTQAQRCSKRLADKSRRRGRRRNRGSPFTDSGCRPDQQGRSHALAGRRAVLTCAFTCAKASTSRRTIPRRTRYVQVPCLTAGKGHVCKSAILEHLADALGKFRAPITALAAIPAALPCPCTRARISP
jgi:hypothetical protein